MLTSQSETIADSRESIAVYGLMLLITVYIGRIQELIPGLANIGVGKMVFILSVLLIIVSPRDPRNSLSGVIQIKYILGILICAGISVPFSYWPGGSMNFIIDGLGKTLIFFFLMVTVVKKISEISKIVWAVVISVFALSLTVLLSSGEGRLSASSTYDPNDLAFVLVTLMPINYYFMKQKSGLAKLALQLTLVMTLLATLATESRGGIVGLIVIFLVVSLKLGKNIKQLALPLIVVGVIVAVSASSSFWERMSTMIHPKEDYNLTEGGGRVQIWKTGLNMMFTHPLNGVGIAAFEGAEGASHTDVNGNSGKWSSPHNSFVQIGAELGFVGLFFFIKLLKSSITSLKFCRSRIPRNGMPPWLLDSVEVAIYGYISTGVFLSQAYSPVLYFLIALVVIIQKLDRRLFVPEPEADDLSAAGDLTPEKAY
jgi:O-antigen ligase